MLLIGSSNLRRRDVGETGSHAPCPPVRRHSLYIVQGGKESARRTLVAMLSVTLICRTGEGWGVVNGVVPEKSDMYDACRGVAVEKEEAMAVRSLVAEKRCPRLTACQG